MSRDEDERFESFGLDPNLMMSQAARNRWNRQQRERNEAILAECESGRAARILADAARDNLSTLEEGEQLDRATREFINTMYQLLREDGFS